MSERGLIIGSLLGAGLWCLIGAAILLLAACASIEDGADSNQVAIAHDPSQPYSDVYKLAAGHCALYRRKAILRMRFSPSETIFLCRSVDPMSGETRP